MITFNYHLAPPRIRSDIPPEEVEEVRVVVGEGVLLECYSEGNPPPQVVWIKENEGRPLSGTSPRIHLPSSNELLLTDARPEDAGLYTCSVSNRAGTAEKQFDLTVLGNFFRVNHFSVI